MKLPLLVPLLLAAIGAAECRGAPNMERSGWRRLERAAAHDEIDLHIALRPAMPRQQVEQIAMNIASPQHSSFRKHLSWKEASSLTDPTPEGLAAVQDWLQTNHINGRVRGGIFETTLNVSAAERLLGAEYYQYEQRGRFFLSTAALDIPKRVLEHIEFITPTMRWPSLVNWDTEESDAPEIYQHDRVANNKESRANCGSNDQVTPSCLKQVYNVTYTPKPNRTIFGVYGTEAASFSSTDLEAFLQEFNPPAASASPSYQVSGSGDAAESGSGIESSFETALDTQTFLGLAWPARGIFYNNGGVFGPNATSGKTYDHFVSFLQDLIHNETVPSVVSFSESMPEDMMDPDYARRLCSMMAQVGARGVSLIFSSGDNGPNGDQPTGYHAKVFETEFPASCPYVTSVGGTVDLADEVGATKSTLGSGGLGNLGYTSSGGGFSNLFLQPNYQQGIVDEYIKQHVPQNYGTISGYNASGRGVPDVSAFSSNVPVVSSGLTIGIGGTSASTPIWGAVIAILNDFQASRGQPPLGFLNPWLYGLKTGLKDITAGGNNAGSCTIGCNLTETLGYNVTVGWDPVTGLGSPNVGLLIEALQSNASSVSPGHNATGTASMSPTPSSTSSATSSSASATASPSSIAVASGGAAASLTGICALILGWMIM